MNPKTRRALALAVGFCLAPGLLACEDPGHSAESPFVRWDRDEGLPTHTERGNVMINEIHFDGSVRDDGTHDPDDVFIELQNKNPMPINVSGWRLNIKGDYEYSLRIPTTDRLVRPNDYFVIAKKADGAFGEIADVVIEDLRLGRKHIYIELRDHDNRLVESAGSRDLEVFAGGYDLVTARSMERVQVLFGNRGEQSRNWHAYSDNAGFPTIREGWRQFTLASPGAANSPDYSGSSTGGGEE